jgi:ribosomal protein L40E
VTNTAYCGECGAQIPATAKFCTECGTRQEPRPWQEQQPEEPAEPTVAQQAAERVEQLNPGAGELAGQLARQLRTPGVLAALLIGASGAAAALLVGLLTAVLTIGETSLIGISDIGIVQETLLHTTQAVGAPLTATGDGFDATVQTAPLLLVAFVMAAIAFAAYRQGGRLETMSPLARIAWSAAGALPFAVLMVIVAVAASATIEDQDLTFGAVDGAVFGLSLLWGVLGGATGAALAIRRRAGDDERALVPAPARRYAAAVGAAARPLAFALIVAAVAATIVVGVQTVRDAGDLIGERSTVGAVIENSTFAIEHGVHSIALGTFAKFEPELLDISIYMPIPVTKAERVMSSEGYRLFDYSDALPALLFIPGMVLLIALPLAAALYAGFAAARAAGATTALHGALFGATVGPVWAIAMVVLNALASKTADVPLFGRGSGDSVFGFVLLIGLVVGAAGGALAGQAEPEPAEVAA